MDFETETTVIGEVTIRAPALDRLVFVLEHLLRDTPDILVGTAADYDSGVMFIRFMLSSMRKQDAHNNFALDDMEGLSQGLLRLIRCYEAAPFIRDKIILLFSATMAGSLMTYNSLSGEVKRGRELKDLSNALSAISKDIAGKQVIVSAERIDTPYAHEFSQNSEFVRFTVSETI